MIVADLAAAVNIGASPWPGLPASVLVPGDAGLPASVALDWSVPAALAGTARQVVGFRVLRDGVEIPPHLILSIEPGPLRIDNLVHPWTVETPIPSPFGSPSAYKGAPPGLGRVDIQGIYLTPTGIHYVPIITGGLVDNAQLTRDAEGRKIGRYQGLSSGARHDRILAELYRAPGHGLGRDRVIGEAAALAGWTAQSLAPGGRMDKEIAITANDSWAATCLELAEVDGRTLTEDSFGNLTNPIDGYNPSRPVDLVLGMHQLGGSQNVTPPGDIVTRITVTGTQQITREACGRRTTEQPSFSKSNYAPRVAVYQQNGAGTLLSTGLVQEDASLQITGRTLSVREWACDTLLAERVYTYGYYNPLAVRYKVLDATGNVSAENGVFLYEGEAGDDTMAYRWPRERLVLIGYTESIYGYDEDGFLVTVTTRKDFPHFIGAALKSRPNTTVGWEDADWITGRLLLGNRSGVRNAATVDPSAYTEHMPREVPGNDYAGLSPGQEREREVITYDNLVTETPGGLLVGNVQRQTTQRYTYHAPQGSLWQYAGEEGKSVEWERLALYEEEALDYLPEEGDGSHGEVRTVSREGKAAEVDVQHGLEGYLPAATRSLDLTPAASSYANATDAANALPASRSETAPIEAEVIDYGLESFHPRNEARISSQWAETPEELQAIGVREIREGSAYQISIELAGANFLIRPGHRIQAAGIADLLDDDASPADLTDVYVDAVGWPQRGAPYGPIVTELEGRSYPP
jgi:hypothetical protein